MIDSLMGSIFRSAWPTPTADRLLRAAMLADRIAATTAWRDFEASADFDRLSAGEMRLVGLVFKHLETLAPDSPMRARIGGIERANWSRSQLAIGEAGSGLRALEAEGVDVLVIKGASRVAADGASGRGRDVNDVDIVVRPGDMVKAFDVLTGYEWRAPGSGSAAYHRTRLPDAIGIKLVRRQFGRLGLHRTAFYPPHLSAADDAAIWQRSATGKIAYATVRVPSVTDAVAIELARAGFKVKKSSDWLADVAADIDSGVDWELFESVADRRRLYAPAAVALRYAQERLGRPVPELVLRRLERGAIRRPLALLATLAAVPPRANAIRPFRFVGAMARQSRLPGTRRHTIFPSLLEPGMRTEPGAKALEQALVLPDREHGKAWAGTIDLTLLVELPPASRYLDFEVNSNGKHHVKLRALVRDKGWRERLLRFKFPVALSPEDTALVLTAAALRSSNANVPRHKTDRYAATPFKLVHIRIANSSRR